MHRETIHSSEHEVIKSFKSSRMFMKIYNFSILNEFEKKIEFQQTNTIDKITQTEKNQQLFLTDTSYGCFLSMK